MEKVYNRLEWDFIFSCPKDMRFHDRWISWIHEYITTVTYSVIINHEVCGFIQPSRRIRQGDSLSPYLFIFFMDVLA